MDGSRTLGYFESALRFVMFCFAIATVILIVSSPSALRGGGVGINARVDTPVTVRALDGAPVEARRPEVSVDIDRRDRDTRVVVFMAQAAIGAVLWAGVILVFRIVREARTGDPFAAGNVRRLRALAALIGVVPLIGLLANEIVRSTFDIEGLRPQLADTPFFPFWVGALGVLALAEVFRRGTELRELEASTI